MSGPSGWLVIDKPLGPTSAAVVGRLKWALRQAGLEGVKIGHGGTLDPLATGVLPIALGEATKLAGYLLNGPKAYDFRLEFGRSTTTDDAEGETVAESANRPDLPAIAAVLPAFAGPIRQRPPAFSALKVDGKRAYTLARAGEPPQLAERAVTIFSMELKQLWAENADFSVHCSKGTYVRSLARDLALALGTVGHVSRLRRTAAGPFGIEAAISLDKAVAIVQERALEQALLPLTAGLDDIPVLAIDPAEADALSRGKRLVGPRADTGLHIATLGPVPVALVDVSPSEVRVVRGFNL